MNERGSDFLEMLIRHEAAVGQLYEAFAALFTDRRDFWQALAADERGHADRLGELGSEPAISNWLLHDSGLRPQAIKSSIGYVESQIVRAQEGRLSLMQALAIAKDLEHALIEEQFSRLSDSVHVGASPILMELAAETEGHRSVLADALDAERRSQGAR
jgi:rubrerythrin